MTYQSVSNAYTAYKIQSALGTAASGGSGKVLRQTGGAGLKMTRSTTPSAEVRADLMHSRGRLGTQKVTGAWSGEASLGSHDDILEAVMRGTWETALSLDESDFTSLAIASNVITLGSGSPIALGLRVGDVIRLDSLSESANNNKNIRISALSATTITTPDTLVDETADTACTITRVGKKLINPAAGSQVKRYYTIEEYETDIDLSESAQDFVFGMTKFSMAPNGLLMVEASGVGTGHLAANGTSAAPVFTSPSQTADVPLSVVDATIRIGGVDVVDLTSFDITIDTAPSTPDVFGSGAQKYAPDVFPGQMTVALNFTALRKDLEYLSDFLAETPLSLHALAVENESEPKDFLSIYVPNFTIGDVAKNALSDKGGARTQTVAVPAALIGQDTSGSGYDSTMIKFQTSAS